MEVGSAVGAEIPLAVAAGVDFGPCSSLPLIAIIGGGIGGVALALALQHRGMHVAVFERDTSFGARRQGYGLTMQQGGTALEKLGLEPEGVSSSSHFVFDTTGGILGFYGRALARPVHTERSNGAMGAQPQLPLRPDDITQQPLGRCSSKRRKNRQTPNLHLPRQRLRQRLLGALRPGTVQWGKAYASHECRPGRGVACCFTDGSCVEAALLVGADGISSSVRASSISDSLVYLGTIVVLGIAPEVALLKERVVETADGCTRLYMMPFSQEGCWAGATNLSMWQLSWPVSDPAEARAFAAEPAALKAEVLRRCGDWHDPIPELLRSTTHELLTGYTVYDRSLPDGAALRAACGPAMTLLGDAA
jgi:salicylate hydroxylase